MTTLTTPALDGPHTGLLAVPFEPSPKKMEVILAEVTAHPWWFNAPATEEERALAAATLVADPFNKIWEVWRGGAFVGLILLWRISPKVDAVLHFIFFDRNLLGKTSLLLSFLGHCYEDLGFRRISIEIPDFAHTLIRFVRTKLSFKFEGEAEVERLVTRHSLRLRKDRDPQVADRRTLKVPAPYRPGKNEPLDIVIAASGSRREAAHWHDGQWFDVLCLRQTAEEYSSFMEGRT